MATSTNFKQQCPSCEALVPIRDPKLIGKKIDCPKCKYRFVVDEPADDGDEDEASSGRGPKQAVTTRKPANGKVVAKAGPRRRDEEEDEDDAPPPKKKGGSSATLMVGIGLGVVALVLLVVGGWLWLGSDDKPVTSNRPTPNTNAPSTEVPPQEEAKVGPNLPDVANLLPNQTEALMDVRLDKLVESGVGRAAFSMPGTFSTASFKEKFGFPPEEVERVVHARSHKEDWVFNILRTAKPVSREAMTNLRLEPSAKPNLKYDVVGADLDAFAFVFFNDLKPRSLALYLVDDRTLVLADVPILEKFLEAKGQFPYVPQDVAPAFPQNPAGTPGMPVPPGPGGMQSPGPGGMQSPGPGGMQSPGPGGAPGRPKMMGSGGPQADGGNPPAGENPDPAAQPAGSWMTVKPSLKRMMEKLNEPRNTLLAVAIDKAALPAFAQQAKKVPVTEVVTKNFGIDQIEDLQTLGLALHALAKDQAKATVALEYLKDDQGRRAFTTVFKQREKTAKEIKEKLDVTIDLPQQADPNQPGAGGFFPGGGFRPRGNAPGGMEDSVGGGGMQSPGPGGMQSPGPGGMQSPGPGGGMMRPGMPGMGMPGMGMPGMAGRPGGGGGDGDPSAGGPPSSKINVTYKDSTVLTTVDLVLTEAKSYETLLASTQEVLAFLKGLAVMSDNRPHVHELAAAISAYAKQNGGFPRGAADRRTTIERNDVPWRPNQRVSWLGEVLGFVNGGEFAAVKDRIDTQKSWRDPENLAAADTLVPCFLSPGAGEDTWWIRYPGLDSPVAATHFVGLAGLGLDAADYASSDASVRKRLGVFGYDRETKLADITDGPEQTIVAIMVPPEFKTPWLAGGGSTVRGVSDTDGAKPFACTAFKGKRGTFAIMANGAVRFLSADLPVDKFNALVTICGDDKIDRADLDKLCPIVKPEELGGQAVLRPVADGSPAPSTPATKKAEEPDAIGWIEFSPPDGGFTVLLPGKPTEQELTVNSPQGAVKAKNYLLQKDGLAFVVGVSLSPVAVPASEVKNTLAGVRDGIVKAAGNKLKADKETTLDGHPGREIEFDVAGGAVMRSRFFVVDRTTYSVTVGPIGGMGSEAEARKFLDSLKIKSK